MSDALVSRPSVPVDEAASERTERDHLRGMERVLLAVQQLSLARDLAEVQRIVRTSARELLGCDGVTFVLRDNDTCYYADENAIAPLWKGSRFPMEICIGGWSMLHREAAVIGDIYADARIPHAAYRPTFVKSLVMVPIRRLEPVGAIGAYWARERTPSSLEVSLLQGLADSTSVAMAHVQMISELEQRVLDRTAELEKANAELEKANAAIRQLTLTDELTGLSNRRGFNVLAEAALSTARSSGRNRLLAYLDIDGLKQLNDSEGHDVGDRLIADVAATLRASLGQTDALARIGGDEFCVLACDTDDDSWSLRNRLVEAFRRFNENAGRPYEVSASIGLLPIAVGDTTTLEDLVRRADRLMYADKQGKLRPTP
jgi:diguanylate cyclase (GGDEF)-like protein